MQLLYFLTTLLFYTITPTFFTTFLAATIRRNRGRVAAYWNAEHALGFRAWWDNQRHRLDPDTSRTSKAVTGKGGATK